MVDSRPSYDVEQLNLISFYTRIEALSSRVRSPCCNVSSSQGDVDSFYRRILAHRMGGPLPSAERT
jgi:hypothetical protein